MTSSSIGLNVLCTGRTKKKNYCGKEDRRLQKTPYVDMFYRRVYLVADMLDDFSRIDVIGQNGNEGLHYMCSGCVSLCDECKEEEWEKPLGKEEEDNLENLLTDAKLEDLFNKISSPESRKAADTMFEDHNPVTRPAHYDLIPEKEVQVIDVIRAGMSKEEFKGFCKGNIIKYSLRAGIKFGEPAEQDLQKARQYIDYLMED
jgi:hypothetical protein